LGGLGRNRIGVLVNRASDFLRRHGRVSVPRLAAHLGYRSPEYFRRSVLPLLVELTECIDVSDNYVVWICEEAEARG